MAIMVVGADHLGHIGKNLQELGFTSIQHVPCRTVGDQKKLSVSNSIDLIIVMVDFVNHSAAHCIKEHAKKRGVPMVFARRSWSSLVAQLTKAGIVLPA